MKLQEDTDSSTTFCGGLSKIFGKCLPEKKKIVANDLERRVTDVSTGPQTIEQITEAAVNETGFGKYNWKVAIVSNLIYMNVAFSLTSISFVLPAASCDFRMTTLDQSRLSASSMIGMLCGSYFWGCMADIKGRKLSLVITLFLHGASELLASVTPIYAVFLCFKFISGMAMIGQMTLIYTYLGEFQPTKYRDRLLVWMEMAWVIGLAILPLVAWGIIPLNIELEVMDFYFHSWNLFVFVCSFPTIIIGLWFITFPETPKYLADTGQIDHMLDVCSKMFHENTGRPRDDYFTILKSSGNSGLSKIAMRIVNTDEKEHPPEKTSLTMMLKTIFLQTIMIVKQPYLKRTVLLCIVSYCVTSAYYTLMMWLPALFQKFSTFQERFPDEPVDICRVTHIDVDTFDDVPFGCGVPIQSKVYIHTLVLGLACVPTGIIILLLINRLGYIVFVFNAMTSGAVTVGLLLVKTSTETLILSCVFEALIALCTSIIYCLVVELYPTNLRATAAGLSAFFARLGAAIGNVMFGYLIDRHCIYLIAILAAELFLSGILFNFIPRGVDAAVPENERSEDAVKKESVKNEAVRQISISVIHDR